MEVADHQTRAAGFPGQRANVDRGTDLRVVGAEWSLQQGLRIPGADIGNAAGHRRDAHYAQSPSASMKTFQTPSQNGRWRPESYFIFLTCTRFNHIHLTPSN
jgi:hypothetical protein